MGEVNKVKPYRYEIHPNIIIEYEDKIFDYLSRHSGSKHLRNLGAIYRDGSQFIMPEKSFEVGPIDLSNVSMSLIAHQNRTMFNESLNESNMLNDISGINDSAFDMIKTE